MVSICFKPFAAFFFSLPLVSTQKSFFAFKTSQTPNDNVFHELANWIRGINAPSNCENLSAVTTAPLHNIRKVPIDQPERALLGGLVQLIVTVAGTAEGFPHGITVDGTGDVCFTEGRNGCRVRKVTVSTGDITTIAGTGGCGNSLDGIMATDAQLNYPHDVASDGSGQVYIAETGSNRIRKVTVSGTITTIAGTGQFGSDGDGSAATSATLANPFGIAVDGSGNVYVADTNNHRIRKVTLISGIITTIVGTGQSFFSGDGFQATSAAISYPFDLSLDKSGNVYIADTGNSRIRKVTNSTGVITTIAGGGVDLLDFPIGTTVDGSGNVYIADTYANRVLKVTASTGAITRIAGTGVGAYNDDNILATDA